MFGKYRAFPNCGKQLTNWLINRAGLYKCTRVLKLLSEGIRWKRKKDGLFDATNLSLKTSIIYIGCRFAPGLLTVFFAFLHLVKKVYNLSHLIRSVQMCSSLLD